MIHKKLSRIREFMEKEEINALLLQRTNNFSWATNGAESYVGIASDVGAGAILITREKQYVLTNISEAPRWEKEQNFAPYEMIVADWQDGWASLVEKLTSHKIFSDAFFSGSIDVSAKFSPLRYVLDEEEMDRYRLLGKATAKALQKAASSIKPGMTELEIAGNVARECLLQNITPIVNMVAVDERALLFKHPLPTFKKMDRYALLVLCARKNGLIACVTRMVHVDKISTELKEKQESCLRVESAFFRATQAGATMGEIFRAGVSAYQKENCGAQWKNHHQGGLTGYNSRELLATEKSSFIISPSQAFAWNPIIGEIKSEDTFLLTESGKEFLTLDETWPFKEFDGLKRPDILLI